MPSVALPVYGRHVVVVSCRTMKSSLEGHVLYQADFEIVPPLGGRGPGTVTSSLDFDTASNAKAYAFSQAKLAIDSHDGLVAEGGRCK